MNRSDRPTRYTAADHLRMARAVAEGERLRRAARRRDLAAAVVTFLCCLAAAVMLYGWWL